MLDSREQAAVCRGLGDEGFGNRMSGGDARMTRVRRGRVLLKKGL
jgi:hypothetical protein